MARREGTGLQEVIAFPPEFGVERGLLMPGLSPLGKDKERAGLQEVIAFPPEFGVEHGPLLPGLSPLDGKERGGRSAGKFVSQVHPIGQAEGKTGHMLEWRVSL